MDNSHLLRIAELVEEQSMINEKICEVLKQYDVLFENITKVIVTFNLRLHEYAKTSPISGKMPNCS